MIIGHYASQKGLSYSSADNKKLAYQTAAKEVLDFIKNLGPAENFALLQQRVKDLEDKLTQRTQTAAATPKPKRSPVSQPATPRATLPAVVSDDEEVEGAHKDSDWLHP